MDEQKKRLIELLLKTDPISSRDLNDDWGDGEIEDIADYLLANGVLVSPCKVGDTVYIITDECEIVEDEVYEMGYGMTVSHGLDWLYLVSDSGEDFYGCDFGKTVFLAREEAETAIATKEKE